MTEPVKSQALAQLDPQSLISQAITSGTSVEAIEKLVDLALRMREVQAREAFGQALAAFQEECPPIIKKETANIRTRGGGEYAYQFASLAGVLDVAQPVANKHGLSIAWKTRTDGKAAYARCLLRHALGHCEEGDEIAIPIEQQQEGGTGASPAQRVGIALTYAKRYAALSALGVAPEKDTDGRVPKGSASGDTHHEPRAGGSQPGREPAESGSAGPEADVLISEQQQRRLWATLRKSGWGDSDQDVETAMHDILAGFQIEHIKHVPEARLEEIVSVIKAGPRK